MEPIDQKAILLSLHYLPCLEYFAFWLKAPTIYIDVYEHYEKQTYRNRCRILTANKVQDLSVPILKASKKQILKDVQIDYSHKWKNNHRRAIHSAYGKAPFFEFYIDYFERIYSQSYRYLLDLNLELLTICLEILGVDTNYQLTKSYMPEDFGGIDLRNQLHPKKITNQDRRFDIPSYNQVFGKGFVANLSIIDLLFCEGPNASLLISRAKSNSCATSFD